MGMTPGEWHAQPAFAGTEILSEDGALIADVCTKEDAAAMVQLPALVALVEELAELSDDRNIAAQRYKDRARALLRALGEG